MRKLAYVLFLSIAFGMKVTAQSGPYIKFDKTVHNFGEVMQDDPAIYAFVFTNTGNAPLVISKARSSCGCTVPSWPKDPILPGKMDSIKVQYNTRRVGVINKQILIESNSSTGTIYLKISGNVIKRPEEVMPVQNLDENGTPFAQ